MRSGLDAEATESDPEWLEAWGSGQEDPRKGLGLGSQGIGQVFERNHL